MPRGPVAYHVRPDSNRAFRPVLPSARLGPVAGKVRAIPGPRFPAEDDAVRAEAARRSRDPDRARSTTLSADRTAPEVPTMTVATFRTGLIMERGIMWQRISPGSDYADLRRADGR